MTDSFDWVLRGGTVMTPEGPVVADLGIRDGMIVTVGEIPENAAVIEDDVSGLHVLPGVIDSQVHFREPGMEHKEDLASGTMAAAMGGVTAIFEMPNTNPNTTTPEALADKVARGTGRAWVDYAFFLGASTENAEHLSEWENLPGCAGIKIFMGSSTGTLLVDDEDVLRAVLTNGKRRVAVHSEDETRLKQRFEMVKGGASVTMHPVWRDVETAVIATKRLIKLAEETGRAVHVLHVTTADEMELLRDRPDNMTVEVTPQHLTLSSPDAYERIGSFAQMNPPIRSADHVEGLWKALKDGVVSCFGSDHAPHTREEKAKPYPQSPSGMPGVQTLVPVLLNHVNNGRLTLEEFVKLSASQPAEMFGAKDRGKIAVGMRADLTVVDMKETRTITDDWIVSKCGWTPYNGMEVKGWPKMTIIKGRLVMQNDKLVDAPKGQPVEFDV